MSESIRLQIVVDHETYYFLHEWCSTRKQKNYSETIREIIKNYQIITRNAQKILQDNVKKQEALKEANEFREAYRKQIIEGKKV